MNSTISFNALVLFSNGIESYAKVYPNCKEMFVFYLDDSIHFEEMNSFGIVAIRLA